MEAIDASSIIGPLRRADRPTRELLAQRVDPAELVLRVLMSSAHRKGSLARAELHRQRNLMLQTIRLSTVRGRPVELTLMAFPFKVPNPAKVGPRTLPDLAEYAALHRLDRLCSAIKAVYEPGLRVNLILDGTALAPIVGIDTEEVARYERYLRAMLSEAGVDGFVELHDFERLLHDGGRVSGELPRLRRAARQWWSATYETPEWCQAFRRMLGMVNMRDMSPETIGWVMSEAHDGHLPPDHAGLEKRVHAAMVEYRAFDLLVHELDPRPRHFPDAIHATTQERPGRLAIWLVRRGRSHLPWHGVGVLDSTDKVRVASASEILADGGYEPVYRAGEETPFLYRRVAGAAVRP